MLTQGSPGAAGFSPQQAALRISYLATEKLIYGICLVIRFALDCHVALGDTLRYLGMYQLISHRKWVYKENSNVYTNLILVKRSLLFRHLQNRSTIIFECE